MTKRIGLISGITYTAISLGAAAIFLAITLAGHYSWVARVGGAFWVLLLSLIISMPLVTAFYRRRIQN